MLKLSELLAAGDALAAKLWPGGTIYHDIVQLDGVRPAAYVEILEPAVVSESGRLVSCTAKLQLTRCVEVDGYHRAETEQLLEVLQQMLDVGSSPSLVVGQRAVHVGVCSGRLGADYAQITLPLSWMDDLNRGPDSGQVCEKMESFYMGFGEEAAKPLL